MSTPPVYVKVARRKQIFAFLMNGSDKVSDVLTKIAAVGQQHEIPEASQEAQLILNNAPADADATLASLDPRPEGLSFHLVYEINDNEYEPVDVEPTIPTS